MKFFIPLLIPLVFPALVAASQPRINGFFVQPSLGYGCTDGWKNFTSQTEYDTWARSMADVGATMLFYQWTSHYWKEQAWYATSHGGPVSADFAFYNCDRDTISGIPATPWIRPEDPLVWDTEQPLKRALDACSKSAMKLWAGLYLNEATTSFSWWDAVDDNTITGSDSAIIRYHIDRTVRMVDDIFEQYGNHQALGGFYYPIEIANLGFNDPSSWPLLAHLIDTVADRVHEKDPALRLAISPFFNTHADGTTLAYPAHWGEMWDSVLAHSDLDILMLQDGVGVEPSTLTNTHDAATPFIKAAHDACERNGVAFWGNCELFSNTATREAPAFVPSSINKLTLQLSTSGAYADTFVCFEFHYMDPNPAYSITTPMGGTVESDAVLRKGFYDAYKTWYDSLVTTGSSKPEYGSTGTKPIVRGDRTEIRIAIPAGVYSEADLFDIRGRNIFHVSIGLQNRAITRNGLFSPGCYQLKFQGSGKAITETIFIQ